MLRILFLLLVSIGANCSKTMSRSRLPSSILGRIPGSHKSPLGPWPVSPSSPHYHGYHTIALARTVPVHRTRQHFPE